VEVMAVMHLNEHPGIKLVRLRKPQNDTVTMTVNCVETQTCTIPSTNLNWVGNDLLCLKCVDHPHGNIADEQKCHHLAPWLAAVVLWQMHATACHVRYKQQLQYHLYRPSQYEHCKYCMCKVTFSEFL
jgi:hypothetical protein